MKLSGIIEVDAGNVFDGIRRDVIVGIRLIMLGRFNSIAVHIQIVVR
jgi:hypothetical protein